MEGTFIIITGNKLPENLHFESSKQLGNSDPKRKCETAVSSRHTTSWSPGISCNNYARAPKYMQLCRLWRCRYEINVYQTQLREKCNSYYFCLVLGGHCFQFSVFLKFFPFSSFPVWMPRCLNRPRLYNWKSTQPLQLTRAWYLTKIPKCLRGEDHVWYIPVSMFNASNSGCSILAIPSSIRIHVYHSDATNINQSIPKFRVPATELLIVCIWASVECGSRYRFIVTWSKPCTFRRSSCFMALNYVLSDHRWDILFTASNQRTR
jgi:hypothetical protein